MLYDRRIYRKRKRKNDGGAGPGDARLGKREAGFNDSIHQGSVEKRGGFFCRQVPIPRAKFQIRKMGLGFVGILGDRLPRSAHAAAAGKALDCFRRELQSGKWDMIILDEINVAVRLKLVKGGDVLSALKKVSAAKIVLLTGRYAPAAFIKKADLVTEMREIKHPFKSGKPAKAALDF